MDHLVLGTVLLPRTVFKEIHPVDLRDVLAQLRKERAELDDAISNLERLEHSRRRGPGRPPNLVTKSLTNDRDGHNSRPNSLARSTSGEG